MRAQQEECTTKLKKQLSNVRNKNYDDNDAHDEY